MDKRQLPWRAGEGEQADPYRVWLSEVMLQQTTVAAVRRYFETFTARWPTVEALAAAPEAEVMAAWAGLGYYARARNLVACARTVAGEHGGRFPESEEGLRALPGIGRYTAAAIAAIAFERSAVVLDTNIERVVARLFALEEPLPGARNRLRQLAGSITPAERPGDYAQAMMDLGASICKPKAPDCRRCPLVAHCRAAQQGHPERYPLKAARRKRPKKQGLAYWLEHDGSVLLVRRSNLGLLGGMLGLPTGSWGAEAGEAAPAAASWSDGGRIGHVFTHFELELRLLCARVGDRKAGGDEGSWWPIERLGEAGLPTLFRKAAARCAAWREAA